MSNAPAVRNQIARIERLRITTNSPSRSELCVARAIARRWDGELADDVVVKVAVLLNASHPQWALKIDKGYFLDIVRDHIAAAQAV